MFALLLGLTLTQSPPTSCITVASVRTCGYGCLDNGSVGRCAQTPQGVCAKSSNEVMCFDPPAWMLSVYGNALPKPSCMVDGLNVACGYDCKKIFGKPSCAQTPSGVCTVNYGAVSCVDPWPVVYGVLGKDTPAPTCVAREGRVGCGYNCVAGNGKIACAKTPFGVCAENGGEPRCFDPAPAWICAKGKTVAKPQCLSDSGRMVCGYACARAGSEVACAQSPEGTCDTAGPGKPTCFDPQPRGGSAACLEAAQASR